MKTLLQGGYVVAYEDGGHKLIENGCVVIQDSHIIYVGFPDNPVCPKADVTIDLRGCLISPGLINLHCIANIDLQPLRIDVTGVGFPRSREWFESNKEVLTDEGFRISAYFSVASLLRNGCTTFCGVTTMASKRYTDPQVEPLALAEAADTLGARAYIAHNFQDHSRYDDEAGVTHVVPDMPKGREGLSHAIKLIEFLRSNYGERVQGFLFPYTTETCSDGLLKEAYHAAEELGVTLRSHFAQYPSEARRLLEQEGISPVERMERLGLLGPRTTLTHAIYLRGHPDVGYGSMATDLALLAESQTNICHCPVVFSRRGIVLRSFDRYKDAGINLALGTDTVPPDLVGEMRMAATLSKVVERDPTAGKAADVFYAATIGGSQALGRNDIGRLEQGAKADITVFNLRALHVGVVDCPIKALVHYLNGNDVEHVYVDGRQVVRNGEVLGIDNVALLAQAQALWWDYKEGLVARDPHGRSSVELYPPALPIQRA